MDATEEEEKKSETTECPWRVDEADEAKYNFSDQKGLWMPKSEDIISMFEQLAKGGSLPLTWKCPGRRAPESNTPNEKEDETEMEVEDDQLKEEYQNPEPSAFDFDDSQSGINTKVTPWRSHAGMARTPKTEKRVARMDNIMDSLLKQQIQRAAEREARKAKGLPSHVQQGRGRLIKFGSPTASKGSSPNPSKSPGAFPISSLTESPIPDAVSTSATAVSSSHFDFVTTPTTKSAVPSNLPGVLPSSGLPESTDFNMEEQELKDVETEIQNKLEDDGAAVSTNAETTLSVPTSSQSSYIRISSDILDQPLSMANTAPVSGHQSSEQQNNTVVQQSSSIDITAVASTVTMTSSSNQESTPPLMTVTSSLSSSMATTSINMSRTVSSASNESFKPPSETFQTAADVTTTEGDIPSTTTSSVERNSAPTSIQSSVNSSTSVATTATESVSHAGEQIQLAKSSPESQSATANDNANSDLTGTKSESEG